MSKFSIIIQAVLWGILFSIIVLTVLGLLFPFTQQFQSNWRVGSNFKIGSNFQIGGTYVSSPSPTLGIADMLKHWLELLGQDAIAIPPLTAVVAILILIKKRREYFPMK